MISHSGSPLREFRLSVNVQDRGWSLTAKRREVLVGYENRLLTGSRCCVVRACTFFHLVFTVFCTKNKEIKTKEKAEMKKQSYSCLKIFK